MLLFDSSDFRQGKVYSPCASGSAKADDEEVEEAAAANEVTSMQWLPGAVHRWW